MQKRNVIVCLIMFIGILFLLHNLKNPLYHQVTIGISYSDPYKITEISTLCEYISIEIDDYCERTNSPYRFSFDIQYVPFILNSEINVTRYFLDNNIRFIVGHDYSNQCKNTIKTLNEKEYILISPYSSDISLSVKNDNLFRLRSNDTYQGYMISEMLNKMNISYTYIISINNTWGNIMRESVEHYCHNHDINILATIKYHAIDEEFTSELGLIEKDFIKFKTTYNEKKVGIVVLSLLEICELIEKVDENSSLLSIPWFSTEVPTMGVVVELFNDTFSNNFKKIELYCPSLLISNQDETTIQKDYQFKTGSHLDYTQAARYDAIWIYVLSITEAQSTNVEAIKPKIPVIANSYSGLTGNCALNDFGDKKMAQYAIMIFKNPLGKKFIPLQ